MTKILIAALAAMMWTLAFANGAKSAWLMCSGYKGTTTLTGFQALVKLPSGVEGFSYSDLADQAGGTDIWFSDTSGNVIPHEIDTWNSSGDSFVWVKIPKVVPVVNGKGSIVVMHWGAAKTAAQTCMATNTWDGFAGVWHMNAGGSASEPDMTGNGLDAAPIALKSGDVSLMTNETSVVGAGRVNTTSTSKGNALKVPVYSGAVSDETAFTLSGWFKPTAPTAYSVLFTPCERNNDTQRFCVQVNQFGSTSADRTFVMVSGDGTHKSNETSARKKVYSDSESLIAGKWVHVAVAFNGTRATAYIDGDVILDNVNMDYTNPARSDFGFFIGSLSRTDNTSCLFCGVYDEVRMYDGTATADRVKADYDTMNNPASFLVEYRPKGLIIVFE